MNTKIVDVGAFDEAFKPREPLLVRAAIEFESLIDKGVGFFIFIAWLILTVVGFATAIVTLSEWNTVLWSLASGVFSVFAGTNAFFTFHTGTYSAIAEMLSNRQTTRIRKKLVKDSQIKCMAGTSDRETLCYDTSFSETVKETNGDTTKVVLKGNVHYHTPEEGWRVHTSDSQTTFVDTEQIGWQDLLADEKNRFKQKVQKDCDALNANLLKKDQELIEKANKKEEILYLLKNV